MCETVSSFLSFFSEEVRSVNCSFANTICGYDVSTTNLKFDYTFTYDITNTGMHSDIR